MKVLYLCSVFPPEVGAGPHTEFEAAESLVKLGHDVTVVTGFPRYNVRVMPPQYRGRLFCSEETSGIRVLRVNAPNFYGKTSTSRGLVQLLTPPVLAFRALFLERPDVVYVGSPPLFMGIAAKLAALRYRAPCVIHVMDLFPQSVVDMRILRNALLIRIFRMLERLMYRSPTAIAVLSEAHAHYLTQRGADPDAIHTVPVWADTDAIRPGNRMNPFREANGIRNEFVVLFAGTMGWFQGLEYVVEAARLLAHKSDILFLMVGDGVKRRELEKQALNLPNVRFLPMQPKSTYPQVLAASDVGLVCLGPEVTIPTCPSKLCSIMAAARPVLASVPRGAGDDIPRRIAEADCGLVVQAGDAQGLASAVRQLADNPEAARRMGIRARHYVEGHLSRTVSMRKLENVLRRVVKV